MISKIVGAFEERGLLVAELPAEGSETAAVVTAVSDRGAYLTLAGGGLAFADRRYLSRSGLRPELVVRAGQSVRVRLTGRRDGERDVVSLLPFEPEPWQRVAEEYREGMLVEGRVDVLRNIGALVTLLPGVRGLLHKAQIAREWVSHPEDKLRRGDWLFVRIVSMDTTEKRIQLSRLDIPEDADPEPLVSLYPDGPAWAADDTAAEPELPVPPVAPLPPAPEPPAATEPPAETLAAAADEPLEAEPVPQPASEIPESGALTELESAIEDGRELQRHIGAMFTSADLKLGQLRAEAAQIRRTLERDLSEARLRLLEFAEGGIAELSGSTEAALAEARDAVEALREQLEAAETDRREMLERLKAERLKSSDAEHRTTRLRKELDAEQETSAYLRRQVEALEPDPERRFVAEVHQVWSSTGTDADRERFPWREPKIGADFLESLTRVQGVSRERVVEVCAHVLSGRAAEVAGLELHPLRSSEGGNAPQLVRGDGAKAWRCSLQASTPAARRLHYWELPDGSVELAKIVYHDDISIS